MTASRARAARSAVRALASTTAMVALYFALPLDRLEDVPPAIAIVGAVALFVALIVWQLRAISRSPTPALRAVEALAVSVPFLVLSFAAVYHVMSRRDPECFSEALSQTDALYFAVTVLATVGFGDIHATSASARSAVTVQMMVNLVAIGLGVRVIAGAVSAARTA